MNIDRIEGAKPWTELAPSEKIETSYNSNILK